MFERWERSFWPEEAQEALGGMWEMSWVSEDQWLKTAGGVGERTASRGD